MFFTFVSKTNAYNQIIYFYNLNFETDNIYAVYENQTYQYQTGTWLVGCWHIQSGLHDLELISDTVDKSIELHINSDTYNIHMFQATPTDMTSSQVMTANAVREYLEKNDHTHTTAEISDVITEYLSENKIVVDISPDEGVFSFNETLNSYWPYDNRPYITGPSSFTIEYNDQTLDANSETIDIDINDITIHQGKVIVPKEISEPITLKFTNVIKEETSYSDTTIVVSTKQATDMNSSKVMTANAINQFTSQFQKRNELLDLLYPMGSIFWTTDDTVDEDKLIQHFGGGNWGVLPTNIEDTTGIFNIHAFVRSG